MTCFDLWDESRHNVSYMPQPNRGFKYTCMVCFGLLFSFMSTFHYDNRKPTSPEMRDTWNRQEPDSEPGTKPPEWTTNL